MPHKLPLMHVLDMAASGSLTVGKDLIGSRFRFNPLIGKLQGEQKLTMERAA